MSQFNLPDEYIEYMFNHMDDEMRNKIYDICSNEEGFQPKLFQIYINKVKKKYLQLITEEGENFII